MEIMFDELPPKIRQKLEVTPEGCWIWTGSVNNKGYPIYIKVSGQKWRIVRFIHTLFLGPPKASDEASHICPNILCCRPHEKHVIFESKQNNNKRRRLHESLRCRKGHDLSGENLVIKGGTPRCKICYNSASRIRQQKKKEKNGPLRYTK